MRKSAFVALVVACFAMFFLACNGGNGNGNTSGGDAGLGDASPGDGTPGDGSPGDATAGDATASDGTPGDVHAGDGGSDASQSFTVGGTVTGLAGTGLVLENNDTDDLAVSADGTFTFSTPVASGNAFSVTVKTQPSGPTQTCSVVGGTGKIGSANVTSVVVDCSTSSLVIGGQIAGLAGGSVVLQNNGGDNLTVSSNGTFAFATPVASGSTYAVTVSTQPSSPSQTCTVSMGTGTVGSANVTSVRVACTTNTYTIGGTVSGLAGTGLVLQDNGGDNLTVSANGTFTFATPVASGGTYAVTVLTQPSRPTQTCAVTTGTNTGTVGGANVAGVAVTCTTQTYTIGGTVTGLAGTGLVLENDNGDDLAVSANGSFTFATPVASGGAFSVTVKTQPSGPTQVCSVVGGTGTVVAANVTSVVINCASNTYVIGGTVSGLAGTVVLQDNGGDDLTVSSNGSFAFATPIASGGTYAVTVLTQPGVPSQTCVVGNGNGPVTNANITSVTLTCTTNKYTVGGVVSGLSAGESVGLQDNGASNLTVSANGTFTFAAAVPSGQTYAVTVHTNPASPIAQTCTVTNGSGTIGAANVTNVTVTCKTNKYTIGGTVSGLAGTGLVLQDNGGDNLTVTSNGTFTFAASIASGGTYAVSLLQNPTTPWQTCVVANGSGGVTNANITSVTVTCSTNKYTVGGTVTGLAAGDSLVLQDNGANNLTVSASGPFTFAAAASGTNYAVTIFSQSGATAQTCTVSGGTGQIGGANVTSVAISCASNAYTIGGTVSGLAGTVVLQDNGGDDLPVSSNGTFAFATPIASGGTYAVTVLTQPGAPSQTCVVGNGSGPVTSANITSVQVTCTTNTYAVGGTLSGLSAGESVVLQDNGADNLTVNADGTFTFATAVPSGQAYAVTVLTNPASPIAQTCTVTNGGGTIGAANVTNVTVTCAATLYTIGGTVSGLYGTGLVLQDNGGDNLTVTGNGTFTFATPIASGGTYAVTLLQNPTTQTCVVGSGSGPVTNANVTSVTVTCTLCGYKSTILADNPVFYLGLDESSGTTARDSTSNGNTGKYKGTFTLGAAGAIPSCAGDTAVTLDGNSGWIDMGDNFGFTGTQPFSVELWIDASTINPEFRGLVTKYDVDSSSQRQGFDLFSVDGAQYGTAVGIERWSNSTQTGAGVAPGTAAPVVGGWMHVVATYDGANLGLYENGTKVGGGASAVSLLAQTGCSFAVGAFNCGTSGFFAGAIDEVAVYPTALSAAQVLAHFQAAQIPDGLVVISPASGGTVASPITMSISLIQGYVPKQIEVWDVFNGAGTKLGDYPNALGLDWMNVGASVTMASGAHQLQVIYWDNNWVQQPQINVNYNVQ